MRSVEYAHRHNVRLHVRSAFTWEPGTWVTEEDPVEAALIRSVVADDSEAKLTVEGVPDKPGIAASLFRHLADADVNVDLIVQNVSTDGVTDISFTVPHDQLDQATGICESHSAEFGARSVRTDHNIAKVSVIGAGMKSNPGVAAKMFETLADNGINIEMISTSAIRVSCVVDQARADDAVAVLHAAYELESTEF
jgi:aspartate kinase